MSRWTVQEVQDLLQNQEEITVYGGVKWIKNITFNEFKNQNPIYLFLTERDN